MGFLSDILDVLGFLGLGGRRRMPPERWARFALDQLFSEKWFGLRKSFWAEVSAQERGLSSISERDFVDELLAAQLALLRFAAAVIHPDLLGQIVFLAGTEYLPSLGLPSENKIELAKYYYDHDPRIARCMAEGISVYSANADIFVSRLGCEVSPEFRLRVQVEFAALGNTFEKDAAPYRFG
jgi:hypothetical protein